MKYIPQIVGPSPASADVSTSLWHRSNQGPTMYTPLGQISMSKASSSVASPCVRVKPPGKPAANVCSGCGMDPQTIPAQLKMLKDLGYYRRGVTTTDIMASWNAFLKAKGLPAWKSPNYLSKKQCEALVIAWSAKMGVPVFSGAVPTYTYQTPSGQQVQATSAQEAQQKLQAAAMQAGIRQAIARPTRVTGGQAFMDPGSVSVPGKKKPSEDAAVLDEAALYDYGPPGEIVGEGAPSETPWLLYGLGAIAVLGVGYFVMKKM